MKAVALYQLGRASELQKRPAEARVDYKQSLAIWTKQRNEGILMPRFEPRAEETERALTGLLRE
ncbi:MAG: hypothetical protein KGN84_09870 [Acidobacteriota bacterium]|nr:hypothetical protein [Acidobacteriota bacterium]